MTEATESWKPIPDFPGYQASTLGRIKMKTGRLSKAKPSPDNGYVRSEFEDSEGNRGKKLFHVLVALTFIPNPMGYEQVNHINGIRHDNRVVNLEWVTASQNSSKRAVSLIRNSKKVIHQLKDGNIVAIFPSLGDAANKTRISMSSISNCAHGKASHAGGYQWVYPLVFLPGEIWKELLLEGGSIRVSSCGRFRLQLGAITIGCKHHGYMDVHVYDKIYRAHRLVLSAFDPRADADKLQVDHIDKNKLNNNLSNLRWVTPSENTRHAIARSVTQSSLNGDFIKRYSCIEDAATENNINSAKIVSACQRLGSSGKFLWRYADTMDSDDDHSEWSGDSDDEEDGYFESEDDEIGPSSAPARTRSSDDEIGPSSAPARRGPE